VKSLKCFVIKPPRAYAASQKRISGLLPHFGSKQREINSFTVACIRANGDVVMGGRGEPRKRT
jgi:hypothetical protein